MTDKTQPEALRLALSIDLMDTFTNYQQEELDKAAAELRRQHAENTTLQKGYDAARLEIESLQAQLEAIGAGGVEPLRRRECLHQIAEPAPAGEYPPLPEPDATTVGLGAVWNRHSMRAYVDAARALLAQAAPQQEAQEPVAWQGVHDQTDLYYTKPAQADVRPLYTTTQPAPAAQGDALDAALTWTVFNSGAQVAEVKSLSEAMEYLTPARLSRQWCAVCVVNKSNLPAAARHHAKEGANHD